jgi:hypothetical protein
VSHEPVTLTVQLLPALKWNRKTGAMQYTPGPYAKVNLGPLRTPGLGLALQLEHVETNMQNAFVL